MTVKLSAEVSNVYTSIYKTVFTSNANALVDNYLYKVIDGTNYANGVNPPRVTPSLSTTSIDANNIDNIYILFGFSSTVVTSSATLNFLYSITEMIINTYNETDPSNRLYRRNGDTVWAYYTTLGVFKARSFNYPLGTSTSVSIDPAISATIEFTRALQTSYSSNFKFTFRAMYRNRYTAPKNTTITCTLLKGTTIIADKCIISGANDQITCSNFTNNGISLTSLVDSNLIVKFTATIPMNTATMTLVAPTPPYVTIPATLYKQKFLAIVTLVNYSGIV